MKTPKENNQPEQKIPDALGNDELQGEAMPKAGHGEQVYPKEKTGEQEEPKNKGLKNEDTEGIT